MDNLKERRSRLVGDGDINVSFEPQFIIYLTDVLLLKRPS